MGDKPQLTNYIRMRWRVATGSLVFYADKGGSTCGLKACPETEELRAMVEKVFDMSTEMPREEF